MSLRPASGAPRPLSPLRAVALLVTLSMAAPHAQSLQSTVARNSETASPAEALSNTGEVQLLVGRSTVISVGQPITRVSLTTPNIADAMVTSPMQLLLHGKAPGTISLFVWDKAGGITRYEVVVQRDLTELSARLAQLFPGEAIAVSSNGKDVVLSGSVSGKYAMEKAAEVAAGSVDKKEDVVLLHSPSESGDGIRVVRKREETLELGELRPMREGQPIHGDVVRLTQREEHKLLFDCEVLVPAPKKEEKELPAKAASDVAEPRQLAHKGPARVTTDAYRGGWDVIFGNKRTGSNEAPN